MCLLTCIVLSRSFQVQQLAHRPHLSPRALYNCIIFLNQLQLSSEETIPATSNNKKAARTQSLPASLINTYFQLFEVAVKKDKEAGDGMKSRLLSALLTGVNRAHPYLPEQDKDLEEHIDSLYRVVHTGPASASTQALMLLFHVAVGSSPQQEQQASSNEKNSTNTRQDRFYRALYATLSQSSIISGGKHLTMYFNLLYKAMKNDANMTRIIAFSKRLLSTTMHTSPPVMAASLFLLGEIAKINDELQSCIAEIPSSEFATATLDSTKREPTAALVNDETGDSVAYAHLWEFSLLQQHYHPSVCKFAEGHVEYTGDPLRDFGLAPFLDKFAYRNPKTHNSKKRGESVAERRNIVTKEKSALPVNDPSFLEKQTVDVQEEFFHKFFVEQARRDEMKGVVRGSRREEKEDEEEAFDIAEKFNADQTVRIRERRLASVVAIMPSLSVVLTPFIHSLSHYSLKKLGKQIRKRKLLSIRLRKSLSRMPLKQRWILMTKTPMWKDGTTLTLPIEKAKNRTSILPRRMPSWTRWTI